MYYLLFNNFQIFSFILSLFFALILMLRFKRSSLTEKMFLFSLNIVILFAIAYLLNSKYISAMVAEKSSFFLALSGAWVEYFKSYWTRIVGLFLGAVVLYIIHKKKYVKFFNLDRVSWRKPLELITVSFLIHNISAHPQLFAFSGGSGNFSIIRTCLFLIANIIAGFFTGFYIINYLRDKHSVEMTFSQDTKIAFNRIGLVIFVNMFLLAFFTRSAFVFLLLYISAFALGSLNSGRSSDKIVRVFDEYYILFMAFLLLLVAQMTKNLLFMMVASVAFARIYILLKADHEYHISDVRQFLKSMVVKPKLK